MFTGIVSHLGVVESINHLDDWEICISIPKENNLNDISFNETLILGASISCSGICLTLKEIKDNLLFFDVSNETASKTNFLSWVVGSFVNIERSLKVGDEIGGHFVYGHVDTTALINEIEKIDGSYKLMFELDNSFSKFLASKGSVTIDGVSLTVNDVQQNTFCVNIIPFTWSNTCFSSYKEGSTVNIEIDILARYLEKLNKNI
ncbi:MAG: riboflavin synthase [Candidatus Puniceispirillales bacterium]